MDHTGNAQIMTNFDAFNTNIQRQVARFVHDRMPSWRGQDHLDCGAMLQQRQPFSYCL